MDDSALILFAHGTRDARGAASFERILGLVTPVAPQRTPMLACLEFIAPDLATAIALQVARGHESIRVLPLFLGPGGHLRTDVPRLVEAARAEHGGAAIELAPAAGEDDTVIAALAAYCMRYGGGAAAPSPGPSHRGGSNGA